MTNIRLINNETYEVCVPPTISYRLCFLGISKALSMLHQESVGQVHSKECIIFSYTFLVYCCFSPKVGVFIIFISFFDEVSNSCNRILTNQKPECILISDFFNHYLQSKNLSKY